MAREVLYLGMGHGPTQRCPLEQLSTFDGDRKWSDGLASSEISCRIISSESILKEPKLNLSLITSIIGEAAFLSTELAGVCDKARGVRGILRVSQRSSPVKHKVRGITRYETDGMSPRQQGICFIAEDAILVAMS